MAYSEKVLDHYNSPRNVGKLDEEDPHVGTGMVGAPSVRIARRCHASPNSSK